MEEWIAEEGVPSAVLAEHLAGCSHCSVQAKQLQSIRHALKEISPPELPAGFDARFYAKLQVEKERKEHFWGQAKEWLLPLGRPMPAFVTALLLFLILFSSMKVWKENQSKHYSEMASLDIELYQNLELIENLDELEEMDELL